MKMNRLTHPLAKQHVAPAKAAPVSGAKQAAASLGESTKLSLLAAKASRTDLRDPSKTK